MLSTSAFAALKDVNVPLGGGTLQPNGELKVSLDPLRTNVAYAITCKINAANSTIMHFSAVGKGPFMYGFPATLNGQSLGDLASGANGKINKGDNELSLNSTSPSPYPPATDVYLDFLNLDNAVTETVVCSASPSVS